MLDNNHEIGVLTTVLPPKRGLLHAKVAHNEVGIASNIGACDL